MYHIQFMITLSNILAEYFKKYDKQKSLTILFFANPSLCSKAKITI